MTDPLRGLPEVDSLATYGGPLDNYEEVVDPTTDQDERLMNVVKANVAGMTQTCVRAWRTVVGKASTPPDEPVTAAHGANWGNSPSVKPIAARTGTGVLTFTWPSTIVDELGVEHTINIRHARADVESATLYHARAVITAANVVTVHVFNAAGAANDAIGEPITVSWW